MKKATFWIPVLLTAAAAALTVGFFLIRNLPSDPVQLYLPQQVQTEPPTFPSDAAPTETTADHKKTTYAIEWLKTQRDPEKPFFMYLSLNKPHAALTTPPEFEALYNIEDIPETPLPPPDWELYEHTTPWRHREAWAKLDSETKKRTTLRYWALCSFSDAQFGRFIDALKEEGLYENTDFIFCSDHGDSLGERYRFSKYSLYEPSVRVPLIVSGPCVPE